MTSEHKEDNYGQPAQPVASAEPTGPSPHTHHFNFGPSGRHTNALSHPVAAQPSVDTVTASEAVYAFAAWLTTRSQPVTLSSTHEASIAAELVSLFVTGQGWEQPRDDYTDRLRTYPSEVPTPPADGQPCDHIFEARPVDGSRNANVPHEAVCHECGYRPTPADGQPAQQGTRKTAGQPEIRRSTADQQDADRVDAERYRMVRRGQRWSVIDGIGCELRADTLDAAVDAARAQQGDTHGR